MTIELEELIAPEKLARLREAATRQHATLNHLVREALETYIEALDDDHIDENTPNDQVLAKFQTGLQQLLDGKGIPANESLARLRKKHGIK